MLLLRSSTSLLRDCASARRATTPCSSVVSRRPAASVRVRASATMVGEDLKAQLKAQKKALKEQKKAAEMKEGSMSMSESGDEEDGEHRKKDKKDKKKEEKEEKKAKMHMDTAKADKGMEDQAKLEKKMQKAERKRLRMEAEARGALYSLHWSVAPSKAAAMPAPTAVPAGVATEPSPCAATDEAMMFLSAIRMDLEKCEKVAKDAVWFATKEAPEGATHMVLVTANAKTAMKYGLEELPQDAEKHVLSLGASVGEVEIPVASLRAMVLGERAQDSDSDSDEEEPATGGMGKATAAAVQQQGGVSVAGGIDAATAAALAFAEMADKAGKAEAGGDMQYPPMRSFL